MKPAAARVPENDRRSANALAVPTQAFLRVNEAINKPVIQNVPLSLPTKQSVEFACGWGGNLTSSATEYASGARYTNVCPEELASVQGNLRGRNNSASCGTHLRPFFLTPSLLTEEIVVDEFVGKNVVVDVESPFVYVGRLHEARDKTLILKIADVHDLRDSTTTREVYVPDARVHGIQPNLKNVQLSLKKFVSVALLEEVIQ